MTKRFLLLLLLSLSIVALAQSTTKTINVIDTSALSSPVALKGSIIFDSARALVNVSGRNQSDKSLLAIVVVVDAKPIIFFREEHDHFYKEIDITPGSTWVVGQGPIEFPFADSVEAKGVADRTNQAEAKVLWVQFEDGSTWGDKQTGEEVFAERAENKAFLLHLLAVQKESGNDGFMRELSIPQRSGSSVESLAAGFKQLQEIHGTAALIDHINKRIEIGKTRSIGK